MDAATFRLDHYFCGMTFFEDHSTKKIPNPSAASVEHALQQLLNEIDVVTRTVEICRMPERSSISSQYCMQFQGDRNGIVVSLGKDSEVFAAPNFDALFGQRGQIAVVGNYWPSRLVCTDCDVIEEIAIQFALKGQLARPEIWEIFED